MIVNKMQIEVILLYSVCIVLLIFALFMAYNSIIMQKLPGLMEANIGKTSEEINEFSTMTLNNMLGLFRIVVLLFIALSIALIKLIKQYSLGHTQSGNNIYTVLFVFLPLAITSALILSVKSPWPIFGLCLLLTIFAYYFKVKQFSKIQE